MNAGIKIRSQLVMAFVFLFVREEKPLSSGSALLVDSTSTNLRICNFVRGLQVEFFLFCSHQAPRKNEIEAPLHPKEFEELVVAPTSKANEVHIIAVPG